MRLITIPVALCLSIAAALAQTPEPAPAPSPPPSEAPAAEASIHGYGDRDKTCLAWTDTCRSCERGDGDTIHCSNVGIACQPAAITCSRRSEPPSSAPPK
jgi:hypothetical protein